MKLVTTALMQPKFVHSKSFAAGLYTRSEYDVKEHYKLP